MRIGIDLDDTICSTSKSFNKYQNKYLKEKKIIYDDLWSNPKYKKEFLEQYLLLIYKNAKIKKNASKILNKLKEKHELYIITARKKDYIPNIKEEIYYYLKNNNITVNKINIDAKDKVDACLNNQIDIMIEDNIYNCNKLQENNIDTILYDEEKNYKYISQRASNWKEIEKQIEKYE